VINPLSCVSCVSCHVSYVACALCHVSLHKRSCPNDAAITYDDYDLCILCLMSRVACVLCDVSLVICVMCNRCLPAGV